jgi:hypothetical protein
VYFGRLGVGVLWALLRDGVWLAFWHGVHHHHQFYIR